MPDFLPQPTDLAFLTPEGNERPAAPGHIARREERSATNWIAIIRLFDGTEIPCNIKDISKSGAKLGVPETYELPSSFMLKIVGRDFVLRVTLAWRRGNYAGVRIDRIAKLPQSEEKKATAATTTQDYHSIGSRRGHSFGD
ncbi:MAG TPA: PilZ domain-containing protein [Methylorubrum populi]|uniref:PilZ domain-containing protein n=1 Tax=Methylorubrum populi TaxID=223967 RepID=A0A921E165_9HYPH|nr:PilZ domain-containing protein [Methylorubrum populi]